MNYKTLISVAALSITAVALVQCAHDQDKPMTDANTPLHLLQPDYRIPYGELTPQQVKSDMDRVLKYLDGCTPAELEGEKLKPGTFRLTSYEWGVTYSAMLDAARATGDKAYSDYAMDRLSFLAKIAPEYTEKYKNGEDVDLNIRRVVAPSALDDCGAVCVSMIRAMQQDTTLALRSVVDNYMDYIQNQEYRLTDGTFARNRPQHNTIWLDDMFMGIPSLAWYSVVDTLNSKQLQDQAADQVLQFAERMWVPEKKLFRHGWVESMQDHPAFHWGRANGWALLTMCEVLDILPENHPKREQIMDLYRNHVQGLAAVQSGDGFWHQLLDRNDSYLETSATAIYTYCIAHGINQGWLDPLAYGPVAQLGWNAVSTKINEQGQVEGTCVGTGMGFDPAYYYYRPVSAYAAHGYGPTIWAGAEMIELLNTQHPKMNDSAVQYYREYQDTTDPIFAVNENGAPTLVE